MFPGSWRVRGSGQQGRGKESRRALTDWEDGEQLRVGLMIRFKTDLVGLRVGNLARLQAPTIESNSNLDGVVKLLVSVVKVHKLR